MRSEIVEAEEAVIANLFFIPIGGESANLPRLAKARTFLEPDDFYNEVCGKYFEAMCYLADNNLTMDFLTITNRLTEMGLDYARKWSIHFSENVGLSINLLHHCRVIKQASNLRRIKAAAQQIALQAGERGADIDEIQDKIATAFTVKDPPSETDTFNIAAFAESVAEQALEPEKTQRGIFTPWERINRITSGLQPSNLIILAARPGVGKTAFAINLADYVARRGFPVAFFSLEMSGAEIVRRMLSGRTGYSGAMLLDGRIPQDGRELVQRKGRDIAALPLMINDKGGISIQEIKGACLQSMDKRQLGLIVVDYIQLVKGPKADRRDLEIGRISQGLKELAKECDCPVLALSQLNRNSENEKRKPRLSDLRESGSLEQDADMVMLLHAPTQETESPVSPTELVIAKHRNGALGYVPLIFRGETTTFVEEERR